MSKHIAEVIRLCLFLIFVNILLPDSLFAQPSPFQNQVVVPENLLEAAVTMRFIPDGSGRAVVLSKNGYLYITPDLTQGAVNSVGNYLTITDINTAGERGLYDIVFDPDFASNGYFYLFYCKGTTNKWRISRFFHDDASGGITAHSHLNTETLIWEDEEAAKNSWHYGGGMDIGPDGLLYLTTGDEQVTAGSQDLTKSDGKVHRFNLDGTIPTDNPYYDGSPGPYNATNGYLESIFASGLRNPFRGRFDPVTNRFYISEVGANAGSQEDLHVVDPDVDAGVNFGWPICGGGPCNNASYRDPIHFYPRTVGRCIMGGVVYRGSSFPASYEGVYFYADFEFGWINYLEFDGSGNVISDVPFVTGSNATRVISFDVGPDGNLYYISDFNRFVTTSKDARIRRITWAGNQAPTCNTVTASPTSGPVSPLLVSFDASANDAEGDNVSFEWDFGDNSAPVSGGPLVPDGNGNVTLPTVNHTYTQLGKYIASLTLNDGSQSGVCTTIEITVGTPPTPVISTPADLSTFVGQQTISFSGSATDASGAPIPSGNLEWEVVFLHDNHSHPVLNGFVGTSGNYPVFMGHSYQANTANLITLTATDANGLSASTSVTIYPEKVNFTITTDPPGLEIDIEGTPTVTPNAFDEIKFFNIDVSAPATQCVNGDEYQFVSWSDGGAASHIATVPASNSTLTASYQLTGDCSYCGTAIAFDGSNDIVNVGDVALSGDFTIEGWIYFADNEVISNADGLVASENLSAHINFFAGRARLYTGSSDPIIANTVLSSGSWHHVAIVRSGTTMQIYLNGTLDNTTTTSWTQDFVVGKLGATGVGNLHGKLDDIRLWNIARSGAEIAADMGTVLSGTETGLEACWTFDQEPTDQTIADITGNGYDGVVGNTPAVGSDDPLREVTAGILVNGCETGPSATILQPLAGASVSCDSIPVKWSYTDTIAGDYAVLTLDGQTPGIVVPLPDTQYTFESLTPGTHIVQISIYDSGNTPYSNSSAADQVSVTTGDCLPVVSVTDPVNGSTYSCDSVRISWAGENLSPGDYYQVSLDGSPAYVSVFPPEATYLFSSLTPGVHTFTVALANASDQVYGNSGATGSVSSTTGDCSANPCMALSFNGINSEVNVADVTLSGDFTIEGWIYFADNQVISNADGLVSSESKQAHINFYGGRARLYTGSSDPIIATTALGSGSWHHVAIVRSGSTMELYLDGVLDKSNSTSWSADFEVGRLGVTGVGVLNGKLDEIRLWNIARTGSEIQNAMDQVLTGGESGLAAYWNFDELETDQSIVDVSGSGNGGFLGNSAAVEGSDPIRLDEVPTLVNCGSVVSGPSVVITSPSEGELLACDSITVSWQFSNLNAGDHAHVMLDGQMPHVTVMLPDTSYTFRGLTPGAHTVSVQVANGSHLLYANSSAADQVSVTTGDCLPVVSVTDPVNGSTYSCDSVRISWAGENLSPGDYYQVSLDGSPAYVSVFPPEATYLFSSLTPGVHTFTVALANASDQVYGNSGATGSVSSTTGDCSANPCMALSFNGINSEVNVADVTLSGDFTIEGWIYFADNQVISNADGLVSSESKQAHINFYGGRARLYTGSSDPIIATTALGSGSWHHVAIVRSGSTMELYLDGVLDKSNSTSWSADFEVGRLGVTGVGVLNGKLDEIRLWNIARTGSEIQNAMDQVLTGGESGLAAYWNFDELETDQSIVDVSGSGNGGFLGNSAAVEGSDPIRLDEVPTLVNCGSVVSGPSVVITSPSEGELLACDSITVSWQFSNLNAGDHAHVMLDGQMPHVTVMLPDTSYTFRGLTPGAHTVSVQVANGSHLLYANSSAADQVSVTTGDCLPVVSVTDPVNGSTYSCDSVRISWVGENLSPGDYYQVSLDGSPAYVSVFPPEATYLFSSLTPGAHTFTVALANTSGQVYGNSGATGSVSSTTGDCSANPCMALSFNGINSEVNVADVTLSGDFTIEGWIYFADNQVISNADGLVSSDSKQAHINFYGGRARLYTGSSDPIIATTALGAGSWHHVAIVRSGSTMELYLDGVLDKSNSTSWSADFEVGRLGVTGVGVLNGKLDEIRLWNIARTGSEIQNAMDQVLTGGESGLAAYWNFDELETDQSIVDVSGSGNGGFLGNSAAVEGSDPIRLDEVPTLVNCGSVVSGPSVVITSPSEGELLACDSITVSWQFSNLNAGDHAHVMLDGQMPHVTVMLPDTSYTFRGLTPGAHTVSVQVANGSHLLYANSSAADQVSVTTGDCSSSNSSCASIQFDGVNDVIEVPAITLSGDFTIEAWMYFEPGFPINNEDGMLRDDTGLTDINFFAGRARIYTGTDRIVANSPVTTGTWHHIAFVRSSGTLEVYLDGVLDNTNTAGWNLDFEVGKLGVSLSGELNGKMDEVRIWGIARTGTQIATARNQLLSGTEPGLLAYWQFDEVPGTQLLPDISGNGHAAFLGTSGSIEGSDPIVSTEIPSLTGCGGSELRVLTPASVAREFKIFPNPANRKVMVETNLDFEGEVIVELYSVLGKALLQYKLEEGMYAGVARSVPIYEYPAGLYILTVRAGKHVQTFRLRVRD